MRDANEIESASNYFGGDCTKSHDIYCTVDEISARSELWLSAALLTFAASAERLFTGDRFAKKKTRK